ncbi:MAG: class I SAM-dependent methyltransferase, partial [Planctomycetota bacterium]
MTTAPDDLPFWERPETVDRFAGRDPDHRLRELVGEYPEPRKARILDLGCAGGRNTVYLAGLGFDVIAIDSSVAMVTETRRRLAAVVSSEEAELRVRMARMDDLSLLLDGTVDFVVALGIL